ncbi:ubiquinone/menaquinone biosynthesis C-methylase UbiE [Catenuloplanes nepalensis]|uniref:Ubiquinone/menaquinone biosynthesis C-methylase UbiE n=1 Tax=Catenuloplanes nepalensis TaxID=587533 RepID=A0ABT9MM93_9ACTN|nr:class I SAM-dependent methyltransferase [Catenuloplanes nepalensis]MDP9792545.1 ubiquinone/menaquinone biosynthesis C-methylase UbiE [Catenuloplanes nepalensis]
MTTTASGDTAPSPAYFLDNGSDQAPGSLHALAGTLDGITFSWLESLVGPGEDCVELGPGAGTLTMWLARQVGPTGSVLALDLDPRHVPAHPRVTARVHDLTREPLPAQPAHHYIARLVLAHLTNRRELLVQARQRQRHGGRFTTIDWGREPAKLIASAVVGARETFDDYQSALRKVLAGTGNDGTFAENAVHHMIDAGFDEVEQHRWSTTWNGGSAATDLVTAVSIEKAVDLAAHGFGPDQLARLHLVMADPDTSIIGNLTYCTTGRVRAAS